MMFYCRKRFKQVSLLHPGVIGNEATGIRMKRIMTRHSHAAVRALVLTCVLMALVAISVATGAVQLAALGRLQQAAATVMPAAVQAQSILSIGSTAQSSAGTGSLVYNGEPITYTFVITNVGATAATNVKIYDSLPADTLDQIACTPECGRVVVTNTVANPLGGTIQVTKTAMITWTVSSIDASSVITLAFRGRVVGKADGTLFSNSIYVSFDQGSPLQGQTLQTTVRQQINDTGGSSLPSVPTWFSTDSGGTLSQAWGDYDHDGAPDLALASSVGTSIYHNDSGRLRQTYNNGKQSYGTAWADVDRDGLLELVVVGDSADGTSQTQGINYVYHYSTTLGTFNLFSTFTSTVQLVRVAAADLDGDGAIDLVGSSNAINAQPAVYAFRNDGLGKFNNPALSIGLSNQATAAIGLGDINNDGLPDMALGKFPSGMQLFVNNSVSGTISFSSTAISIDKSISFLPYGFSFGDYDGDGFLDLAAAFPLQREARIYHNLGGTNFSLSQTIRTNIFWTPLAVDWADFTGDGAIDLVIADSPPKMYYFDAQTRNFQYLGGLTSGTVDGQIWDIYGVQSRPYQGLSLALTDRDQSSMVFDSVMPALHTSLYHIDPSGNAMPASGLTLGDLSNSGMLDVLYGASEGSLGSRKYVNQGGTFASFSTIDTPLGPQNLALADMAGDGQLDIAVGSSVDVRVYSSSGVQLAQIVPDTGGPYKVAWGDINGDGLLDLLVGTNGPVYAYLNHNGSLATTPIWTSPETCNVSSLAWADYDKDNWLDFAVGCRDAAVRLYHNTSINTFSLAWTAPLTTNVTSLAWADSNADGYPDLAVGADGSPVALYENVKGTFGQAGYSPVWQSPTVSATTSIAWGDWNNDGYPDLAVGNSGDSVQVFGNFGSQSGQPRLFWVWSSSEKSAVTGVAWGDMNSDGYKDLVVSSVDSNMNGIYFNGTATPAQFSDVYTPTLALPQVGPYVTLHRPGTTNDAFLYSSSELLGSTKAPTVTVHYKVFAPDGTRVATSTLPTLPISRVKFEYSLNGGGTWLTATPAISSPAVITQATRLGSDGTFIWDPVTDKAISSDALFRVTVVKADAIGPVQRSAGSAISPPFQVRATTCTWPAEPSFTTDITNPQAGALVHFYGAIGVGSGPITVTWDFGDGSAVKLGQNTVHSYTNTYKQNYTVKMMVVGAPCPITRPVYTTTELTAGNLWLVSQVFLPYVTSAQTTSSSQSALSSALQEVAPAVAETNQITTLLGDTQTPGSVHLAWAAPGPEVTGYRVYRHVGNVAGSYDLLATLPANTTDYVDAAPACGQVYYVTALVGQDESLPSTAAYYGPACSAQSR
jgi:hypothetical protein